MGDWMRATRGTVAIGLLGLSAIASATELRFNPTADGRVTVAGGNEVRTADPSIRVLQSGGLIRNAILEFNLSNIDDGAAINGARLDITLTNLMSNTGGNPAAVDVFAYLGDGLVDISDFNAAGTQVFDGSRPLGGAAGDVLSFSLGAAGVFEGALAGDLLTLRVETDSFASFTFASLENGTFSPASLTILTSSLPGISVVAADTTLRESTSTTTPALLARTANQTPIDIANRIGIALRSSKTNVRFIRSPEDDFGSSSTLLQTGTNAGDSEERDPWSVWFNVAESDINNNFVSTRFYSKVRDYLFGVDSSINDDLLVGVAASYQQQDVTTLFNSGTQDIDTFTITPYGGWIVNNYLTFDLMAGYANSSINQSRTQNAALVTSSPDGHRGFVASNVSLSAIFEGWIFDGSAGIIYIRDFIGSFSENNGLKNKSQTSELTQGRIGGSLAYSYKNFEPYVNAYLVHDFHAETVTVGPGQATPNNDDDELDLGLGIRYFNDEIMASVAWNKVRSRSNISSHSVSATLRIEF